MSFKKALIGIVAMIAACTVSGCATGSPGQAAVVDGQVLSETWLDGKAQNVVDVLASVAGGANSGEYANPKGYVLNYTVVGMVLEQALSRQDVVITEVDRQAFLSQVRLTEVQAALSNDTRTSDTFDVLVDLNIVTQLMSLNDVDADQLMTDMAAVPASINPRYGEWDATQVMVSSYINGLSATPLSLPSTFPIPN